jgi:N-acetylglucosamine-6-sulfatase
MRSDKSVVLVMRISALLLLLMIGSLAFAGEGSSGAAAPSQETPPSADPVKPVPRDRDYSWMTLASWQQRHAAHCAVAAEGKAELIFLGDSITAMTENSESWKNVFGSYRYANFGIGGDRTQNVLWRLENGEIGSLKPKLVVLLVGTNNIGITESDVADTVRGVTAVVEKLKSSFSSSKILVLGLFPRERRADAPVRETVKAINEQLLKLADGKRVFARDIGSVFLDADGTFSPTVSPDELHLTEEGMRRWAEAIAPDVKRLMD